jgi:hypothetical protein
VTKLRGSRATDGDAPVPGDSRWPAWLEREAISPEGVDRALVREQLSRTPEQRLEALERAVNDLLELRGGRWPELS